MDCRELHKIHDFQPRNFQRIFADRKNEALRMSAGTIRTTMVPYDPINGS